MVNGFYMKKHVGRNSQHRRSIPSVINTGLINVGTTIEQKCSRIIMQNRIQSSETMKQTKYSMSLLKIK